MNSITNGDKHAIDSGIFAVAAERDHDLHDDSRGQPAPASLGDWPAQSGALAGVDCGGVGMGLAAHEYCAVDCVRKKPSEMEQVMFEAAVWAAFAQCFLSNAEALAAIHSFKAHDDDAKALCSACEWTGRRDQLILGDKT